VSRGVEAAATRPTNSPSIERVDISAQCRVDFLRSLAHLNLGAVEGAFLAEQIVGQPFLSCGLPEITRAAEAVRDMLRRTTALPPEYLVHA
jgi:hypothetical protein